MVTVILSNCLVQSGNGIIPFTIPFLAVWFINGKNYTFFKKFHLIINNITILIKLLLNFKSYNKILIIIFFKKKS